MREVSEAPARPPHPPPKRGQQQSLKVSFWCDQTTELYKFHPKHYCGNSRGKNFGVRECPLEVLTQRGRRWALSSDLPFIPLNRRCPFELQAWGTIAHRGPRGEGWLLAGRGFRIILIDLSAPFSTFHIFSSRAFYTFLPFQLARQLPHAQI